MISKRSVVLAGALALATLTGCGTQQVPPTPTAVPTAVPTPTLTVSETAYQGGYALGESLANKLSEDATDFVLKIGVADATENQMVMALFGLLVRLDKLINSEGGETALADCKALLPGVILRVNNTEPLEQLLAACEAGDKAQIEEATAVFAAMMQ